MPELLAAADLLEEAATVVIAGDPVQQAQALATAALTCADPAVVVLRTPTPDGLPAGHPAFGKPAGAEGAAAYVCRRNVCGLPIADQRALAMALAVRNG